jgi:hypothetical protein
MGKPTAVVVGVGAEQGLGAATALLRGRVITFSLPAIPRQDRASCAHDFCSWWECRTGRDGRGR